MEVVAALFLGFLLPGWSLGRLAGSPAPWTGALVLSLPLFFVTVLGMQALGLPLQAGPVALVLGVFTAVAWYFSGKATAVSKAPGPKLVLLLPLLLMAALLLLRTALQPLAYVDNLWRWDYLAVLVGQRASLDFYPPVSSADYLAYPYADGIPPTVSLCYWFLYQVAGRHDPSITSGFLLLQYLSLAALTWRLGTRLFGPWAGSFAVGALVSSRLMFRAVALGHETGLTALALMGALDLLVLARDREGDWRPLALAGLALSTGPNSREYALAFLPLAAMACLWLRLPARSTGFFLTVATLFSAPWYLRNWVRTGNPVFDNPVAGLWPGNPVHLAMLETYAQFWRWQAAQAGVLVRYGAELVMTAPLQVLGLALAGLTWRRTWFLTLGVLGVGALWYRSAPFTAAGGEWAMRVLAPALPLASLLLAAGVERLARRVASVRILAGALLAAACLWTLPFALTWATPPEEVPFAHWAGAALHSSPPQPRRYRDMAREVLAQVPAGGRIVSHRHELVPLLARSGISLVPVWSPEVRFLFDPRLSQDQARDRLAAGGIHHVLLAAPGRSLDLMLLNRFAFFSEGPRHWTLLSQAGGMLLYRLDPTGP